MYWDLCNGILAYGNLLHSNSTVCYEKPAFFINHWTEWANVPMFIAMSNYWRVYYLYIIYMGTGSVFSDIMGIFHWACQVWFGSQNRGFTPTIMNGRMDIQKQHKVWCEKDGTRSMVSNIIYIYIYILYSIHIYIYIYIYIDYIILSTFFLRWWSLQTDIFGIITSPIDKHL